MTTKTIDRASIEMNAINRMMIEALKPDASPALRQDVIDRAKAMRHPRRQTGWITYTRPPNAEIDDALNMAVETVREWLSNGPVSYSEMYLDARELWGSSARDMLNNAIKQLRKTHGAPACYNANRGIMYRLIEHGTVEQDVLSAIYHSSVGLRTVSIAKRLKRRSSAVAVALIALSKRGEVECDNASADAASRRWKISKERKKRGPIYEQSIDREGGP